MSDDYVCTGKRKSKGDKKAKSRYNRYKKGGSMRVSGKKITNEIIESEKSGKVGKSGNKRKKKKK